MWSLAAHELEICVVAYSYDGIIELKNAVFPDYLLCDSASIAKESHKIGFPFDKTILVKSHRSLKKPNRGMRARNMKSRIVYADTFFCGQSPYEDPGCSYLAYHILIQAALSCPDIEFNIKFHPIRGKKNQNLAWSGFDEGELLMRKKYITDLMPSSNVSFIDPEYKLSEILDDYDILINLNSFAAIEAFEIGIPVIFLSFNEQFSDHNGFNYFNENGSLLSANNSNELVEMLYSIIQNNKLRGNQIHKQYDFISNYLYPESQNRSSTIDSLSQNYSKLILK
jgi:CDP-glycerol glycerophosphotransferase (TagB/SpsB family)